MSASQPPLELQHLQHANPYFGQGSDFQASSRSYSYSHASHSHHFSSRFQHPPSSSSSPGSVMDPSQFGDFSFTYGQGNPHLSNVASVPDLSDHSTATYDDQAAAADQFALHSAVSSVPTPNYPTNVNSMSAPQSASYNMDSEYAAMKMDAARENMERHSPGADSVGDDADEFGPSAQDRADGTDLGGKSKDDKPDAAPAWSELKTKAGKDRKRLPLACIACRRKKIRCSGEKPACKHCLRSRIPCVYKVTSRKAAPRTDYMAMLDKRLKRMEERIIKVVPKADPEASPPITRAVVKPNIPGPNAFKNGKKRRADEAFSPSFESWVSGSSKAKVGTDQQDGPTALLPSGKEDNKLFEEGLEALPPKDIQEHLSEVFFDNVYGQPYHLLHKPSYMRKLKSNSLPPVLILSVCAVAARFSTNPKLNSTARPFLRGEEWASHARDICTRRYEWPNITILTCLVLLGVHEFGTCHGGRSWSLSGQAIRMAYALQLHKDLEYDPQARGAKTKLSFVDREIRRRAMWACFLMDRSSSSGTDRPMFIKEESIQIPLPVSERHFELDMPASTEMLDGSPSVAAASPSSGSRTDLRENMGAAAYIIRAIAIWGRVVTYLNHGGREMDSFPIWDEQSQFAQLVRSNEDLLSGLPTSLQYSRENLEMHITEKTASQILLLHATLAQISLFLHQSAASILQARGNQDVPKVFAQKLSGKTFVAANRISQLLRDADETQSFMYAPFGGYCAFSSTSVQLLAMMSGNQALKATAEANCAVNVKFLRKLMRYWGMFHWMVEDIRKQYKTNYDSARKGLTAGSTPSNPPQLLQYADWFNRYPHGVADTEFMDPSAGRKRERGDDAVLEQKAEFQSVEEFFTTLSPAAPPENQHQTGAPGPNGRKPQPPAKKPAMNRPGQPQNAEQLAVAEARRRASIQVNSKDFQQGAQRRFSSPHGNQNAPQAAYNQVSMAQASQQYMSISPISPGNVSHFPGQTVNNNNMGFFGDVMPMNIQQENPMAQSMFTLTPGGSMGGSQQSMDGWQGQNRAVSGPAPPQGHMAPNGMNMFAGAADATSWFMPYDVEPPEASQDMGLGNANMDAFGGMFGSVSAPSSSQGMMAQSQMRGLQNGM